LPCNATACFPQATYLLLVDHASSMVPLCIAALPHCMCHTLPHGHPAFACRLTAQGPPPGPLQRTTARYACATPTLCRFLLCGWRMAPLLLRCRWIEPLDCGRQVLVACGRRSPPPLTYRSVMRSPSPPTAAVLVSPVPRNNRQRKRHNTLRCAATLKDAPDRLTRGSSANNRSDIPCSSLSNYYNT